MLLHTRIDTFTDSGTDQLYPLGTEAFEGPTERFKWETSAPELFSYDGARRWIYIKNTSAAAFVKGSVVTQKAVSGGAERLEVEKAPVSSQRQLVVGVAQAAIAAGSYGWVVREGDCEVLAGTETIDVNEIIAVSATDAGTAMEQGSLNTGGTIAQFSTSLDPFVRAFGYARENAAAAATARCYVSCVG